MTKTTSFPIKGKSSIYIGPEASAICTVVMVVFSPWPGGPLAKGTMNHATKLISTQLSLSLLNCRLTGGYDISAEPKLINSRTFTAFILM